MHECEMSLPGGVRSPEENDLRPGDASPPPRAALADATDIPTIARNSPEHHDAPGAEPPTESNSMNERDSIRNGAEVHAFLRDGQGVRLRPARPSDAPAIRAFVQGLSIDALERRFFSPVAPEVAVEEILSASPGQNRASVLVERDDPRDPRVIGHGEWVRSPAVTDRAEVAFLVSDQFQGQGAATLLLRDLARRARGMGVTEFEAVTEPDNRAMLDVFWGCGFPCHVDYFAGEARVRLDISRDLPTSFAVSSPAPP